MVRPYLMTAGNVNDRSAVSKRVPVNIDSSERLLTKYSHIAITVYCVVMI